MISFEAVVSVPCFELWLLLHFEDIQAPLHRHDALCQLKNHIPDYDKGAEGIFNLTSNKLEIAIERAQILADANSQHQDQPYSDIHKLIKELMSL
jgi:hypothetical protein